MCVEWRHHNPPGEILSRLCVCTLIAIDNTLKCKIARPSSSIGRCSQSGATLSRATFSLSIRYVYYGFTEIRCGASASLLPLSKDYSTAPSSLAIALAVNNYISLITNYCFVHDIEENKRDNSRIFRDILIGISNLKCNSEFDDSRISKLQDESPCNRFEDLKNRILQCYLESLRNEQLYFWRFRNIKASLKFRFKRFKYT